MNYNHKVITSILPIFIAIAGLTYACGNSTSRSNNQSLPASEIPQNAEKLTKQAAQKFDNKDYKGAYDDANEALKIYPNIGDAHLVRGASRYFLGEQQEGIEDVKIALQIYKEKGRTERYKLAQEGLSKMESGLGKNDQERPNTTTDPCQERIDLVRSKLNEALSSLAGDPIYQMGVTNKPEYHHMLQEARSLYTDPNCPSARQEIGTTFRTAWQSQVRAKREYGRIYTFSIKGQCEAGCNLSNLGGNPDSGCNDRCRESYRRELASQDEEYNNEIEEIDRFFSGR